MDTAEFAALFRPQTRAWFNWDRCADRCTITTLTLTGPDQIGAVHTPWYRHPDGTFAQWRDQGATRCTVADAATDPSFLPEQTAAWIATLHQRMRAATMPADVIVPGYLTAAGNAIILDGNHRVVAAALAAADGTPARVTIVAATGADHEMLLPDLLHEVGATLHPALWALRAARADRHFLATTAA